MIDTHLKRVYIKKSIEISIHGLTPVTKGAMALTSAFFIAKPAYEINGPGSEVARPTSFPLDWVSTGLGPFCVLTHLERISTKKNKGTIMKKIKKRLCKLILPSVATIITAFPYCNFTSRMLDKLIFISEAD